MSVMKRGMPPGGMNPVPVKVAVKDKPAPPVTEQHVQPDAAKPAVAALNRVQGGHASFHSHTGPFQRSVSVNKQGYRMAARLQIIKCLPVC